MLKINKKQFCSCLNEISAYYKRLNKFCSSIEEFSDGYFNLNIGDSLVSNLIDLLADLTNSQENDEYGNDIMWWLFEDVPKVIYIDDVSYDVSTPELLYDFLEMADKTDEV